MTDLLRYREEIDHIDQKIIELLERRFDTSQEIIRYKQRKGLPILDAGREQQKLDAMADICAEDKKSYIAEILKETMAQSRRYQAEHPLRYGLLGRTLGHSHSPAIHRMLGGYEYGLFEREPEHLDAFFAQTDWQGINVTIPYKRDVMKYCDELSDTAQRCGSVNTIVRRRDGRLYGTNTDYYGFRYIVERSGIDPAGARALVLGSGGVSGTVVQVMKDLGADPVIISRTGENNYGNLELHADAQIIINTTPVGMFPKAGEAALDICAFPRCQAIYDLIYNPLRTKLMLDAEKAGIPAFGGLPMLVAQAAAAAEEFGYPLQLSVEDACRKLQEGLQNIVLIGMPGAGKTTTGKALAQQTGRRFLDMDNLITQHQGKTPEEIIREDGEARFREIETQVLEGLVRGPSASAGGLVIATGGGIVERDENRELIRENGQIIWLRRPLEELPTEGRPISQADGLAAILKRREPLYEAWSDIAVDGIGPEETAARIEEGLGREESQRVLSSDV
ncbi:MAG: chorismate mutase [Firmicutes bacterium]|nr:chorismate mutase [Bacillota bacterium]